MSALPQPVHIKTARAALHWTQTNLAREANVSLEVVKRFESGEDIVLSSYRRMIEALEACGVAFVFYEGAGDFNSSGLGVALRTRMVDQ